MIESEKMARERRAQPKVRVRVALALLGALGTLGATAAVPAAAAEDPAEQLETEVITTDGADSYRVQSNGSLITVSAPAANQGRNLRMVGVARDAPHLVNQRSCLTWEGPPNSLTQPGLALRVRHESGRSQAITVTDNIWMANRNTLNVHLVEWANPTGAELEFVGAVTLPLALGPVPAFGAPLPWRLCARVQERTVEVVAWPLSADLAAPPWGDDAYSGTVQVPADWVYAGQPGWYAGHLGAGEDTRYRDLATGPHRQVASGTLFTSMRWLRSLGGLGSLL